MDKYLVRCDTYGLNKIEDILNDEKVLGVVLGDILCAKRMFDGGIPQQILLMDRVLQSGKTLVYQVPLYVTGRNFDLVKSILDLINGYNKISYAIVQDFGTASLIARNHPNIKLIWGIMGRVRERRFSDDFLSFLKQQGFTGMETCDPALMKRLAGFGLTPYYGNCELQYQTLGRRCYLEYQAGFCAPSVCRSGCYSLKAEDNSIEMTVNGYILGEKKKQIPADEFEEVANKYSAVRIIHS